jgi:hypothetical protein
VNPVPCVCQPYTGQGLKDILCQYKKRCTEIHFDDEIIYTKLQSVDDRIIPMISFLNDEAKVFTEWKRKGRQIHY